MKNINSILREVNRDMVKHIKDGDTTWYLPKNDCTQTTLAGMQIHPVSFSERVFKGHHIHVGFTGETVSKLQLVVFVNGKLKYVSKRCFEARIVRFPKIVRKGWWFETIMLEDLVLCFKHRAERDRFNTFCTSLKEGNQVQDQFAFLRRDILLKDSKEVDTTKSITPHIEGLLIDPQ